MKKFYALMMVITMTLAGCGGGSGDSGGSTPVVQTETLAAESETSETQATWDTIVMGTSADFPPFEFISDDGQGRHGQYDGIDVAIAVRLAEHLGAELVIQDADFMGLLMDLNAGRVDFVAAALTVTEERAQQVAFSDSYFTATQYIVVLEGETEIQNVQDLSGMLVGVQIGTTGDIFVSDELEGVEVQRYNRASDAFRELLGGRLDAIVIDAAVAELYVQANAGQLEIIQDDEAFEGEEYSIAVRHEDTELLAAINEVIAEMRASGEINDLFNEFVQN